MIVKSKNLVEYRIYEVFDWLRRADSNHRPSGYEPDELPDCSTPRRSYRCYYSTECDESQVNSEKKFESPKMAYIGG